MTNGLLWESTVAHLNSPTATPRPVVGCSVLAAPTGRDWPARGHGRISGHLQSPPTVGVHDLHQGQWLTQHQSLLNGGVMVEVVEWVMAWVIEGEIGKRNGQREVSQLLQ